MLSICAHDPELTIDLRLRSALMMRSRSDTHDLRWRSALTIYAHRLRSRSGTHYLRSRSTLAVCAHDLGSVPRSRSRTTLWRPIPTSLRTIYAINVVRCWPLYCLHLLLPSPARAIHIFTDDGKLLLEYLYSASLSWSLCSGKGYSIDTIFLGILAYGYQISWVIWLGGTNILN